MSDKKKKKLFTAFLESNDVLVLDPNTTSRRRLAKTIGDLGAVRQNVHSFGHYSEAVKIIEMHKPQLIISEYSIGDGSGFDLFKMVRETYPDEKKMVLVLVTADISQSAVAQAAEEDVDSFIIKPYTADSFEKSLVNAVIAKLYPSKYVQMIEQGKEQLFAGDYESAAKFFEESCSLNPKPTLGLFYLGQAKNFLNQRAEAEVDYSKGLEFNNIHFKCQIGLYDLLLKEKRYEEAYAVVNNISKYFPSNPNRLTQIIRLCVQTKNFKDMESYYEIFKEFEERTDEIIQYVCSGLFVAGKYFLQQGDMDTGKKLFEKLGISCQGTTKFLRGACTALAEFEEYDEARKYLSRFVGDDVSSQDYMISSYMAELDNMNPTMKMQSGLEIFNSDTPDFTCFKIMVQAMIDCELEGKAKTILIEAEEKFPGFKADSIPVVIDKDEAA